MFLFFCYSLFFENGNLSLFFYFLPYYSLYYFLLNVYLFVITKFKSDFDILILESYYKKIYYIMELNEKNKNEYKKFLLFGYSEFKFEDSIYLGIKNFDKNSLTVKTYKHTINKFPNDFFSRMKKINPIFPAKNGDPYKE